MSEEPQISAIVVVKKARPSLDDTLWLLLEAHKPGAAHPKQC